jgi:hypothetical protein
MVGRHQFATVGKRSAFRNDGKTCVAVLNTV